MTKPGGEDEFREARGAVFGDVAVALSLLSGEVIHEVTHTLNFLRLLQDSASDTDAEITRFAQAELERTQRMVRHLRRLKLPAPEREDVSLAEVITQSIERVQESVAQRGLSIEARIPVDAVVRDDAECLRSALRNMLLDMLDRAPAGSSIAITAPACAPQPLQLEFSDEGEALPGPDVMEADWQNEVPSRPPISRRTLAHRLLRHLGWSMSYERHARRNVIRLTAPMPMSRSL
jgi:signal transduction histidine kinase